MAVGIILQARETASPGYIKWFAGLDRFEAAVMAFSIALAVLASLWRWSVLHLLRQNGRVLLRLEAVEAELGLRPAPPEPRAADRFSSAGFSPGGARWAHGNARFAAASCRSYPDYLRRAMLWRLRCAYARCGALAAGLRGPAFHRDRRQRGTGSQSR